ncbi:MAG: alanine racemase [Pseudomonadota bacterium]
MIHTTYAVIHLDAITHNVKQVRLAAPNSKVMAVIKANAYGHGLQRIAHALERCVDGFAVARVQEGVRLRKAGIQQRIVVLEGFTQTQELDDLHRYQLEPSIHSAHQLTILNAKDAPDLLAVWVKIDTGMNRLGFKPHDIPSVYEQLNQCPVVKKPLNFMTHFANADDKNDPKTLAQINLFNELTAEYSGEKSMANSAGILAWEAAQTDWVRAGIMIYGISPFIDITGSQLGLKPLMSLHSRLIAVRDIDAGETVGYSGLWTSPNATKIGVIAIGYGDGYPRYARNGTPVLINGVLVPLVGRVSMDMITVDLGLHSTAQAGDNVTLWGEGLPIEKIAHYSDTIPYTLVCGVTPRVDILEST